MFADISHGVLVAMVLSGATVLVVGCYQYLLMSVHSRRRPYGKAAELYPRVAVVLPAWNEAAVIERTLLRLMEMDYPRECVRVYVVDDASTDETPEIAARLAARHPGSIVNLRRENGGEGKAQTINHGLREIQREGWYEAVLVIDADVLLTPDALGRMTRHFGDETVGGVMAYIKEGSRPAGYINRFISFEYITAQAAARRAQNVLNAHACLAGGAQLIRRSALEEIGGHIDTTTLAEDTVTTFGLQLAGYRVEFEGNAVVWAEEPPSLAALWKQRLRWGRGNVQVTKRFRKVWLRRGSAGPLGGVGFAAIWFSVVYMPLFVFASTTGLVTLFFIDRELSIRAFEGLWALTGFTYLFVTLSSLTLDPETGRRCWREGIFFPGAVNLMLIAYGLFGVLLTPFFATTLDNAGLGPDDTGSAVLLLCADIWLSAAIFAAWVLMRLESRRLVGRLVPPLLYVVGYGPLLCAITVAAYVAELRGSEQRWEKTEKVGRIGEAV